MDRFERAGWNDEKCILQNYCGDVKMSEFIVDKNKAKAKTVNNQTKS